MKLSRCLLFTASVSVTGFRTPSPNRPLAGRKCLNALVVENASPATSVPEINNVSDPLLTSNSVEKDPDMSILTAMKAETSRCIEPGRYDEIEYSIAIPFLKRPDALDGSHAGDYGFDPLGLTEKYDLYAMQEAELRHARLAMLAVVGWSLSELVAPSSMLQNGCAPSVLNGFNPVSLAATLIIFSAFSFFEVKTCFRRTIDTKLGSIHHEDMKNIWEYGVAGDYNFDPLNLYSIIGDDAFARKGLRDVEISHGRSAMLGITAFAGWETLVKHPIVENSMFFHPNLLLPSLAIAYVAFNEVYKLDISEKYIQFVPSTEGKAKLEYVRNSVKQSVEQSQRTIEPVVNIVGKVTEKGAALVEKLQS